MSRENKLDLNFKMEEISKAVLEIAGKDGITLCIVRETVLLTLIYRRQRIYREYLAEQESYERLYGHYKEGEKVPKKVNSKIKKINRMVARLTALDTTEERRAGAYIPYNDYWPTIKEKLEKALS